MNECDSFKKSEQCLIELFFYRLGDYGLSQEGIIFAFKSITGTEPYLYEGALRGKGYKGEVNDSENFNKLLKICQQMLNQVGDHEKKLTTQVKLETIRDMGHEVKRPFSLLSMILEAASIGDDIQRVNHLVKNSLPLVREAMDQVNRKLSDLSIASKGV